MSLLRSCALALLLALTAAPIAVAQEDGGYESPYPSGPDEDSPPPAPPDDDESAPPADLEPALAPYGAWVDVAEYGRVWHPAVASDWRPYADGSWAWTSYGWTWVAAEPWGWTFHYGRWAFSPVGWVWVPGTVWGPAWVDWYWSDGFVAWAPLAPFGHVTVIDRFVFVRERDFCSRSLRHAFVERGGLPRQVVDRWSGPGGRRDFRPPPRDRIEHVSEHPVPRLNGRPPGTVAPTPVRDGSRRDRRPEQADEVDRRPGRIPRRDVETPTTGSVAPAPSPSPWPHRDARPGAGVGDGGHRERPGLEPVRERPGGRGRPDPRSERGSTMMPAPPAPGHGVGTAGPSPRVVRPSRGDRAEHGMTRDARRRVADAHRRPPR